MLTVVGSLVALTTVCGRAETFDAWRAALESRVTEFRAAAVLQGDEIVYSTTNAPYGQTLHPFTGGVPYDIDEVSALVWDPVRDIVAKTGDGRPLDQVAQDAFLNELPRVKGRPYTVPYWSRTRDIQMRLCDLLRVGAYYLSDKVPSALVGKHSLAGGIGALGNRGQLLLARPESKSVIGVFANTENAGEVLATTEEFLGPSLMEGSEPEAASDTAYSLPGAPCGIRAVSLSRDGMLWRFAFETAYGVFVVRTPEGVWTLSRAFMELPQWDDQKMREVSVRVKRLYRNRYRVDIRDQNGAATTTLLLGYSAKGLSVDAFTVPRANNARLASVRGEPLSAPLVPHDPTTDSFGARHRVVEFAPDAQFARNSEADLVELSDGRLLLGFGRMVGSTHDNAACSLWKCLSSDGGKTWSEPAVMIRPPKGVANVMEVNFRRLKDGGLSLVYLEKRHDGVMPVFRLSRDEGETWSDPVDMVPARAAARAYIIANGGHLVELKDGRLILPVASVSLFAVTVSDDGGRTWRLLPEEPKDQMCIKLPSGKEATVAEPALVELKDGRLMTLVRTQVGAHYRAYSSDRGETWSSFEPSPLKAPAATPNLARLSDGRLVAVWNELAGGEIVRTMFPWHYGWRKPLTLALSDDEGESWYGRIDLETEGWCCMPFITEVGDSLFVGYGVGLCLDTLRVIRLGLGELAKPGADGKVLPGGPGYACAEVEGVSGRAFVQGSGVFTDCNCASVEMPPAFEAVNFIPTARRGKKTLHVTAAGTLLFLAPEASAPELSAQGFRRTDYPTVVPFVPKKDGRTLIPEMPRPSSSSDAADVWMKPVVSGECVTFGEGTVPLVRKETAFRPSEPRGEPFAGAASRVRPKRVVCIGFDGLGGWYFGGTPTPVMDGLRREGAWTVRSRSILPSSSAANWHAILACSGPEKTGYQDWHTQVPFFRPAALTSRGYYPDVFAELRAQRPEATSHYLYEWKGMAYVADIEACTVVRHVPKATGRMTDIVCDTVRTNCPDFLFVHYDDPDGAGHGHGWGSEEYQKAVREADAALGRIVAAIRAAGLWDETVLVVTSDHGGKNRGHGGPTEEEMDRILFFAGKGVRPNLELVSSSAVYDTGATLAALLGLVPPQAWTGRPVDEAFRAPPCR